MGISGTSAAAASRVAPLFTSLMVNDRLIVASGKTPTTSPACSAASASRYEPSPASRSTGMWCMPRISGPEMRWSKTCFLAMNRTSRRDGLAPRPQKMKSR